MSSSDSESERERMTRREFDSESSTLDYEEYSDEEDLKKKKLSKKGAKRFAEAARALRSATEDPVYYSSSDDDSGGGGGGGGGGDDGGAEKPPPPPRRSKRYEYAIGEDDILRERKRNWNSALAQLVERRKLQAAGVSLLKEPTPYTHIGTYDADDQERDDEQLTSAFKRIRRIYKQSALTPIVYTPQLDAALGPPRFESGGYGNYEDDQNPAKKVRKVLRTKKRN